VIQARLHRFMPLLSLLLAVVLAACNNGGGNAAPRGY
jgi:predicted small secreted protein